MGAMLQMMQQMMGKGQPDQKPGQQAGNQAGDGMKGDSDAANTANGGPSDGNTGERRVPKSTGRSGAALPPEFQKTLDAYNKREAKAKPLSSSTTK